MHLCTQLLGKKKDISLRAKKYGPQPVRTEARECGSGYAMERAVREGELVSTTQPRPDGVC